MYYEVYFAVSLVAFSILIIMAISQSNAFKSKKSKSEESSTLQSSLLDIFPNSSLKKSNEMYIAQALVDRNSIETILLMIDYLKERLLDKGQKKELIDLQIDFKLHRERDKELYDRNQEEIIRLHREIRKVALIVSKQVSKYDTPINIAS